MSAIVSLRIGAVAAGLSCLLLGVAIAQQENAGQGQDKPTQYSGNTHSRTGQNSRTDAATQTNRQYTANYRGTQANEGEHSAAVDRFFANCMLLNNQAEVELGQMGAKQAQNPQVKEFAQELVKDHQKLVQQLQQIAGKQASARSGNSTSLRERARLESNHEASDAVERTPGTFGTDNSATKRTVESNTNSTDRNANEAFTSTGSTSMHGDAALHQIARMARQIDQRCNQSLREALQQKSGAQFDEAFVGAQINGHIHMLAALEVISQDTHGQLQQIAQNAQPTVRQHLEKAKQLWQQLTSGERSAAQAQRPSASRETQR